MDIDEEDPLTSIEGSTTQTVWSRSLSAAAGTSTRVRQRGGSGGRGDLDRMESAHRNLHTPGRGLPGARGAKKVTHPVRTAATRSKLLLPSFSSLAQHSRKGSASRYSGNNGSSSRRRGGAGASGAIGASVAPRKRQTGLGLQADITKLSRAEGLFSDTAPDPDELPDERAQCVPKLLAQRRRARRAIWHRLAQGRSFLTPHSGAAAAAAGGGFTSFLTAASSAIDLSGLTAATTAGEAASRKKSTQQQQPQSWSPSHMERAEHAAVAAQLRRSAGQGELPDWARYVVHPQHKRKVAWDLWIAVLIVYSCISVPLRIGFSIAPTTGSTVTDGLVDLFFALDMALAFRTAYVTDEGECVVKTRKLATRYLRGWFTLDLLSTIPFDLIVRLVLRDSSSSASQTAILRSTKLLRVLRLLRLARLLRFAKIVQQKEEHVAQVIHPSAWALLKMMLTLFFVAHLLGCMWHWMTSFSDSNSITWVSLHGIQSDDLSLRYLTSVYWAFTTMATVGFGDIVGSNNIERAFAVWGMIVGASTFGYILGNVTAIVESFNVEDAIERSKMNAVNDWLSDRRMPHQLAVKIQAHYKYVYRLTSVFDSAEILDTLPPVSATAILYAQHGSLVKSNALLCRSPPALVAQLLRSFIPCKVTAGDVLYSEGDLATHWYVLHEGGKIQFYASVRADPDSTAGNDAVTANSVTARSGNAATAAAAGHSTSALMTDYRDADDSSSSSSSSSSSDIDREQQHGSSKVNAKQQHGSNSKGASSSSSGSIFKCGEAVAGQQFGHEVLLPHAVYGSTAVGGIKPCALLTLRRGQLLNILQDWPETREALELEGRAIRKQAVAERSAVLNGRAPRSAGIDPPADATDSSSCSDSSDCDADGSSSMTHTNTRSNTLSTAASTVQFADSNVQCNGSGSGGTTRLSAVPLRKKGALSSLGRKLSKSLHAAAASVNSSSGSSSSNSGSHSRPSTGSSGSSRRPAYEPLQQGQNGLLSPVTDVSETPTNGSQAQFSSWDDLSTGLASADPDVKGRYESGYKSSYNKSLGGTDDDVSASVLQSPSQRTALLISTSTDSAERCARNGTDCSAAARNDSVAVPAAEEEEEHVKVQPQGKDPAKEPLHSVTTAIPGFSWTNASTGGSNDSEMLRLRDKDDTGSLTPVQFYRKFGLFHPDSHSKMYWDIIMSVLIVVSVVEVTTRLSFRLPAQGTWLVWNWLVDISFAVDMLVTFYSAVRAEEGIIITKKSTLARLYLRRGFTIDIISTVPFDKIARAIVTNGYVARSAKLLRVVRLIRLMKVARLLRMNTRFASLQNSGFASSGLKLVKLLLIMFFAAHIGSCVWHAVGASRASGSGWMSTYCPTDYAGRSRCISDESTWGVYLAGVYFVLTIMTTTGYGDIVPDPNSKAEILTVLALEVMGTTMFAWLIGNVVSLVLNINPAERNRKQMLGYLSEYIRYLPLSTNSKKAIRTHYSHQLAVNSAFDQSGILRDLPAHLQQPAAAFLCRHTLQKLPLHCRLELSFPGAVVLLMPHLRPALYRAGDVIATPQVTIRDMAFITKGQALVRIAAHSSAHRFSLKNVAPNGPGPSDANFNGTKFTVSDSTWFGESLILLPAFVPVRVKAHVRAGTAVHLLFFSRKSFDEVEAAYPALAALMARFLFNPDTTFNWISVSPEYAHEVEAAAHVFTGKTTYRHRGSAVSGHRGSELRGAIASTPGRKTSASFDSNDHYSTFNNPTFTASHRGSIDLRARAGARSTVGAGNMVLSALGSHSQR